MTSFDGRDQYFETFEPGVRAFYDRTATERRIAVWHANTDEASNILQPVSGVSFAELNSRNVTTGQQTKSAGAFVK